MFWYVVAIFAAVIAYYIWFYPRQGGSVGDVLHPSGVVGSGIDFPQITPGQGFSNMNPSTPGVPGEGHTMGTVSAAYNGSSTLLNFLD